MMATLEVYPASLMTKTDRKLLEIQETQVRFLGWEETQEKGMVIHSSILVCSNP